MSPAPGEKDGSGAGLALASGDAVHPVDGPAVHAERGVVLADRVLVRPVEQAVHLAVGLWYSSTCRTPNWSARSLRVSSAICAMASGGSLRSAWKSMNLGMSVLLPVRTVSGSGRPAGRTGRRRAMRVRSTSTAANRRDQRGHDRDQGDLPARHASHDHGVDHGDRSGVRRAAPPPLPPTGIIAVDAEAPLAKPTAMTARLASTTPSLLKLLMVRMNSFSLPGRDRGRRPGPLRSLQCDGMAAPPRSGSGALPGFCVPVPQFSAGQPDGAAGHAAPLRWDSCPPTGQSGPCDRSGQNSPRGRLSGVRAGSRTRRQRRAAARRRDRGARGRVRAGSQDPGTERHLVSPRSAAAQPGPLAIPAASRLHRNGDDDQLTGIETKLRFSNHAPASAPRMRQAPAPADSLARPVGRRTRHPRRLARAMPDRGRLCY